MRRILPENKLIFDWYNRNICEYNNCYLPAWKHSNVMVPGIYQSVQQKSWLLKASRPSYLKTILSKLKWPNTFASVDYHLGEARQVTRITLESKDKSNCSASSFEIRWGANFEAEFVPSFKSMIPSSSKYLTQWLIYQNFLSLLDDILNLWPL